MTEIEIEFESVKFDQLKTGDLIKCSNHENGANYIGYCVIAQIGAPPNDINNNCYKEAIWGIWADSPEEAVKKWKLNDKGRTSWRQICDSGRFGFNDFNKNGNLIERQQQIIVRRRRTEIIDKPPIKVDIVEI